MIFMKNMEDFDMQSGRFTDKAKTALMLAEKTASKMHAGYVGTEHVLVGLLKERTGVAAGVLSENGVEEDRLLEMIKELIVPESVVTVKEREGYSPRCEAVLEEAHRQAQRFYADQTGTEHILLAMLKEGECVATRLLKTMGIAIQKVYIDTLAAIGADPGLYKEDLSGKPRSKKSGTSTLDQYSRDLTALALAGKLDPVIGRDDEIKRVIEILSRRSKNKP